ncbi:HR-like lesion-inducer [Senna tora]|uniref:HR-like lesion-inducer n=1 Tax=Senna tora TaxID=362788 RepID=A0A834X442_9FABA|nr:HR-like lesion-inducer [Senna tora]
MAFSSFVGRVLFASVFILSAWQEFTDFGNDGGPAAKALRPKVHTFSSHVLTHTGFKVPDIEMKDLVAVSIFLKGIGGPLFMFDNSLGAYLLLLHQALSTPLLCDFYNYEVETRDFSELFIKFTQNLALFGALLFYIGMKNSMPRRQLRRKALKDKTI